MHSRTMILLKKEQASNVCEYSQIAWSLHVMDNESKIRIKKKFNIAFMIVKENMAFTKMKPICELEKRLEKTCLNSSSHKMLVF